MPAFSKVRAWLDEESVHRLCGKAETDEEGRGMVSFLYGMLQQEWPVTVDKDSEGKWYVEGPWEDVQNAQIYIRYHLRCLESGEQADPYPILSKSVELQSDNLDDMGKGFDNYSFSSILNSVKNRTRRRKRPRSEVRPSYVELDEDVINPYDADITMNGDTYWDDDDDDDDASASNETTADGEEKVRTTRRRVTRNGRKGPRGPYRKRNKEDPNYHLNLDGTPKKKRGRPPKAKDPNVPDKLECPEAGCAFSTGIGHRMKEHQIRKHGEKEHQCPICPKRYGIYRDLQRHLTSHTDTFQCDKCGKQYKCANALNYHQRVHEPGYVKQPVPCSICNKNFSTLNAMKLHVNTVHLNMKNFLCNYCGKAFAQKRGLQEHENVHLGRKPYVCDECGMAFHFSSSLKDHKLSHDASLTWTCEICGKVFHARGSLKTHMAIHTSQNKFKCEHCPKSFYQKAACQRHMRTHTGERPYACTLCGQKFSDSGILRRHMIGLHKVNYVRGKRGRKPGQGFLIVNDPNQPGGTEGNATVNVHEQNPHVATDDSSNIPGIAKTINDAMIQDPVAAAAAAAAITVCTEPEPDLVVYDSPDKYINVNMMSVVSQPVFPNLHDSESQHSQTTIGQPMEAPPPPIMSPRMAPNQSHLVLADAHTATHTPVTSHGEGFNLENMHTQMYGMQPADMGHLGHPGLYRFPANLPYIVQSTHPHSSYLHPHPQVPPAHSNPPSNDATTRSLIYSATNYTN